MSARGVLAGLHWPWGGSAQKEPSAAEVYEGRLQVLQPSRPAVSGVNFLDVADPGVQRRSVPPAAPQVWVPWCEDCQLLPVGGPWTLACAEYLGRQHDAVMHGGAWTSMARRASDLVGSRDDLGGAR